MQHTFKKARGTLQMCLCALLLWFTIPAFAQTQNVNGVVVDDHGEPLIGATVQVVGKAGTGTVTDLDGKFKLKTPESCIISVSFMSYKTTTMRIKPGMKMPVHIQLFEDSKQLNEVVVTALGITREAKSLGYARQSVNTDDLDDVRDPNLLNSLTGKVAGVNFISNGGPMASTRVEIRGNNSITGNNQPLYVVDGVPIMNDMGESGDLDYGNAASFINPDDIESIEVLKGANASALYGSDAANGVILITTRQAKKKSGLGINYNFNAQFSYLREFPTYQNIYGTVSSSSLINNNGYNYYNNNKQNGYEYNPDLLWGIYVMNWGKSGTDARRSWGMPMLGYDIVGRNNEIRPYSPQEKAITNMYETGVQMTHNLSIDKVFDNGSIRASYTYIDYDGMLKNFNNMKRHNFSLNANATLAKWMTMNASVNYQLEDADNRDYKSNSDHNPMIALMRMPRDVTMSELIPYKRETGQPMVDGNSFYNPYWLLNELSNGDSRNYFRGNVTFNIKPYKGFNLRLRGAMERTNKNGWTFNNYYTMFDPDGQYDQFSEKNLNNNFEALLSYSTRLKKGLKDLSINANVGASYMKQEWDKVQDRVEHLAVPDVKSLTNNASLLKTYPNHTAREKQSVYGQLSLGYKGFFLDGTFRNDWSSTLPAANRSYFYTSGSFSAVLTDMIPALHNNKTLSFAKLRGSIARVGNDTDFDRLLDGYKYGDLFRDMAWYAGENTKKNNNLKPETTISSEIGLELRFWGNRLKTDVTYYDKRTKDQIIESTVSYLSNYQCMLINSGEISNKGWEVVVSGSPIRTHDFEWSSTFNWSKNNSMVESLPDGIDKIQLASGMYGIVSYAEVGKPFGALYGWAFRRNDKGQILCGIDGSPLQSIEKEYLANVQAKWRGGWQNTFKYKNWSISTSLDFQHGGHFFSQTAMQAAIDGESVQSLQGRDEYFFATKILGEDRSTEVLGFMMNEWSNTTTTNGQLYPDWARVKGMTLENCVYDESAGPEWAGKPVVGWARPDNFWMHYVDRDLSRFIYSASYLKLREVVVSYDFPKRWLRKTPFQGIRLAAVGRNIATLFSNTPKGIDPQSTSTTGNGQGFERGYCLPESSYGFDIKVQF